MRAAVYCRISDDRAGSGLGVKRQEADCRELCSTRGFEIVEVLVDNDLSAYSGKPRPGYLRLLDAAKAGTIDVVVAWHPDRITRSPRELEDLVELVESTGVDIATVTAGDYDLATPTGRIVARIVGATARQESEHKANRNRRKARELADAGKVAGGGTRPFGYDVDRRTVRDGEAALIREAATRILAGVPIRAIVRDWHQRGITTPTGKAWQPTPLRRLLMSARISGRREHLGVVTADAEWAPIITVADSDRIRAVLGATRAKRAPRRYALTGIARCGLCDALLVARPRGDGTRCYVCARVPGGAGCGKIRVLADPIEELIAEAVQHRLDTPALGHAVQRASTAPPADDPMEALGAVERRAEELAEAWAAGELTRAEWQAARRGLDTKRDELRSAVAEEAGQSAVVPYLVDPGLLASKWQDLDFDQRRAVLESVLESVKVDPARRGFNRFDPSRVDIAWRA